MAWDSEEIEHMKKARLGNYGDAYSSMVDNALDNLKGSTIVNIGFIKDMDYMEGGLTIDYQKENEDQMRRVVFGYNELGTWIKWEGELDA